jgi:flavodoxin
MQKTKTKILIAYYSRTGLTKKVAEELAKNLKAETEEIKSVKNRKGVKGYLISGKEAMQKIKTRIKKTTKDPKKYDLVIIGTPVWAWNMSSPIRTYISNNNFNKIAVFATQNAQGAEKTTENIEKVLKKKAVAKMHLKSAKISKNNFQKEINKFIKKINKKTSGK